MLRDLRVTLRPIERDDLPRFHELGANIDLMVASRGKWEPRPLAWLEQDFEASLKTKELHEFAIVADGTLIGRCGLHNCNRREGTAELGIGILDPAYLSKGYGREAIALILDYAFRIQNYRRVWLTTDATNERAVRSYLASGFIAEGQLRQHYYTAGQIVDGVIMGMLREEWLARTGTQAIRNIYA
jgi:diamine N-acetyltransferase